MTAGATAPGKIMLAGEYAILDGSEAVLVAVSRRAWARVTDTPQSLSPFLAAARACLSTNPDSAYRADRIVVDTSAFRHAGIKLGLGSSAAATVTAVACALQTNDRDRVHAVAHVAHGDAQAPRGARGSGADIAASIYGGVVVVRRDVTVEPRAPLHTTQTTLPPGLCLVPVMTGVAADTPTLVSKVRALCNRAPTTYAALTARIADGATRLVRALGPTGSAHLAVDALATGGDAVRALGEVAGTAIWTDAHTTLQTAIRPIGAIVKPTGAGGGDIALAAAAGIEEAELRAAVAAGGMTPLPLHIDPIGVQLQPFAPPLSHIVSAR